MLKSRADDWGTTPERRRSHFPSPEWRSWLENDAKPTSQSSSRRRHGDVGLMTPVAASKRHQGCYKTNGAGMALFWFLMTRCNAPALLPLPETTPIMVSRTTLKRRRWNAWKQRLLLWVFCLCLKECFGENGRLWYHLLWILYFHYHPKHKNRIYVYQAFKLCLLYCLRTYLSPLFSHDEYSMNLLRLRRGTIITGFSLAMGNGKD